MAVFVRAPVAVATGVPAMFAFLAALLTIGSPGPIASAAEPAAAPAAAPPPSSRCSGQPGRVPTPKVDVTFRIATHEPVVFLTIDDGVHKNRRALRYVEATRLPVTAFLCTWTVKDAAPLLHADHAVGWHPEPLGDARQPGADVDGPRSRVCCAQRALTKDFGSEPWMMRPPYGAGYDRQADQMKAIRCGISRIVMWDAVVEDGRVVRRGNS